MLSSAPTLDNHPTLLQAAGSLLPDTQLAQVLLGIRIPLLRLLAIPLHLLRSLVPPTLKIIRTIVDLFTAELSPPLRWVRGLRSL